MIRLWLLFALVVLVASESDTEQPSQAWILGSKGYQSAYAVEGMEYVIEYDLFNAGDQPATSVTLDDRSSYPTTHFDILKGDLNIRFQRIQPSERVTHVVVVRPAIPGTYNSTAAMITYHTQEGVFRAGLTTTPKARTYVYRLKDYEQKYATKYTYWLKFLLMVAPWTIVSFYAFNKSRAKYEALTGARTKVKAGF